MSSSANGVRAERQLYKIVRGSYSRREGDQKSFVDPETQRLTRRKSQPFVHYSARTTRNPNARDEVFMTDAEARAFGLHNLQRLHRGDNNTELPSGSVEELMERQLPADKAARIAMLIEEGNLIRKNRQLDAWRKRVFEAEVLTTELPNKRLDVVAALQHAGQQLGE